MKTEDMMRRKIEQQKEQGPTLAETLRTNELHEPKIDIRAAKIIEAQAAKP